MRHCCQFFFLTHILKRQKNLVISLHKVTHYIEEFLGAKKRIAFLKKNELLFCTEVVVRASHHIFKKKKF